MDIPPELEKIRQILVWIGVAEQLLVTRFNRAVAGANLPFAQFIMLNHFRAFADESHTIGRLANAFETGQPGISKTVARLVEKGVIEIAPLAYMRGRTLSNAFIVLDEAQNTTAEQMMMFLTRLGDGSKMVVTGDLTQIDLPRSKISGLHQARQILADVPGVSIYNFGSGDVVRHPLVLRILEAYDRHRASKET